MGIHRQKKTRSSYFYVPFQLDSNHEFILVSMDFQKQKHDFNRFPQISHDCFSRKTSNSTGFPRNFPWENDGKPPPAAAFSPSATWRL